MVLLVHPEGPEEPLERSAGASWGGGTTWGLCAGGDRSPSPLCPCSGGADTPRLGHTRSWAVPGATAVVGMAGESGFLQPESCRAAAGEEAPAESPLPHWAGHEDLPWLAELMGTGVGRDPRTAPGWDLALPGHPGQHLCSTGAGPEQCWQSRTLHLCLCPRPAPLRLGAGLQEQQCPDSMAQPAPRWTQQEDAELVGLSMLWADHPPAPQG